MKVSLFSPAKPSFKGRNFGSSIPPLGLGYVNGYLKQHDINTELIDLNILLMRNRRIFREFSKIESSLSIDEFLDEHEHLVSEAVEYLLENLEIDDSEILGFSLDERDSIKIMYPLLKEVRKKYPLKKIVAGGIVAGCFNTRFDELIDCTIFNEGEEAFVRFIKNQSEAAKIQSDSMSSKFDISRRVLSLDKTLVDSYRIIPKQYELHNDLFRTPIIPYSFSKGCNFNCTFCSYTLAPEKPRHLSPEKIVDDLKKLKADVGYRYFYFLNPHLSISKDFINELCDHMIDSKLDILWSDSIKPVRYLSQNTYYKLREAGCVKLSFGIEAGAERIMKLMNKGHTISDCENSLKFAHKAGIWNLINIIAGFPTENEDDFNELLGFVRRNMEFIDMHEIQSYYLSDSYIRNHPEEFNIKVRSDEQMDSDPGGYVYDEISGKTYEELLKTRRQREFILKQEFEKTKRIQHSFNDNMIFPLYDNLADKSKVRRFMSSNHSLISKDLGYESIYTGSQSNQHMKGNLQSSVAEFQNIPFADIKDELDDIRSRGFTRIIIVGGEPFIRKDILKLLKYLRFIGFEYIVVKSNARMLKIKEFCRRVSDYVDEILVVEFDKANMQQQEGIRNWTRMGKSVRH